MIGIFDLLLHQLSTSFVGHRLVVWAGIAESLTAGRICVCHGRHWWHMKRK